MAETNSNQVYDNFFLETEIEDQYNSYLDLQNFFKVDNSLVGTPGMKVKINVYKATDGTEKVEMGDGNTKSIAVTLTNNDYEIVTMQNRFEWFDEQEMTDPNIIAVGVRHMATDMFNTVNKDFYTELGKATLTAEGAFDFAHFVDAQALLKSENLPDMRTFAFVSPKDEATIRKTMNDNLKYVEAFAKTGYVGTVAGVDLYTKKDATEGSVYMATRDAVTLFNKKGTEVESVLRGSRDADNANIRRNYMYSRKYYVVALTDKTKVVKLTQGE